MTMPDYADIVEKRFVAVCLVRESALSWTVDASRTAAGLVVNPLPRSSTPQRHHCGRHNDLESTEPTFELGIIYQITRSAVQSDQDGISSTPDAK